MAEEVTDSSTVVPKSMILGILVNGICGLGMTLAFLFTTDDLLELHARDRPSEGTTITELFERILRSSTAAVTLSALLFVLQASLILGGISCGSRLLWAFARERAFPGWRWIYKVE